MITHGLSGVTFAEIHPQAGSIAPSWQPTVDVAAATSGTAIVPTPLTPTPTAWPELPHDHGHAFVTIAQAPVLASPPGPPPLHMAFLLDWTFVACAALVALRATWGWVKARVAARIRGPSP